MHELGLLERFLERPHTEIRHVEGRVGDETIQLADLTHLPTLAKFVAMMPQWDFLDFLAEEGARFPEFDVRMSTEAIDLFGRTASSPASRTVRAGPVRDRGRSRHRRRRPRLRLRDRAGLKVEDIGAPIDVLWLRLPRRPDDPNPCSAVSGPATCSCCSIAATTTSAPFVVGRAATRRSGPRRALTPSGRGCARVDPDLADRVDATDQLGRRQAADRHHRPAASCGRSPGSCSSATPRTRCRRWAASASTSPIRTPSAPPTFSPSRLAPADRSTRCSRVCSAAGSGPVRRCSDCRCSSTASCWHARSTAPDRSARPGRLRLFNLFPVLRRIPARIVGMGFRMEHVRTRTSTPADALATAPPPV